MFLDRRLICRHLRGTTGHIIVVSRWVTFNHSKWMWVITCSMARAKACQIGVPSQPGERFYMHAAFGAIIVPTQ